MHEHETPCKHGYYWCMGTERAMCSGCLRELKESLEQAIKLLRDCYTAGHREGWQDGPTSEEVFERVDDFLSEHDPGWLTGDGLEDADFGQEDF